MELRHWTALLRVMSLMVLADSRVREEEIRVFVFRMKALRDRLGRDLMFSEGLVRDWFGAHRGELSEALETDADAAVTTALAPLDDFPQPQKLVDALNAVAKADGERHPAEVRMIACAAERWGTKIPRK